MFGDFTAVARTQEPDEAFGYLCAMVNVAINAARNAHDELRRSNEQLLSANLRLQETIAEQKRAEEEIRRLSENLEWLVDQRTAELRAANQELDAFSYSVSHDLRAPLRAIDGNARMLLEDHAQSLDAEGMRKLNVISGGARKMGRLIDDLLEFSRMGRTEMRRSTVDMPSLVQEVIQEVLAACPERKIEIQVGALPAAQGDRALLRQVWVNLIDNAVKYTKSRMKSEIAIAGSTEDSENIYWIEDNGVGFEMEYAHKLFGVFQRLHPGKEFEGTGVGLALAQRVVQRHGGRVWARAEIDKGATFYFALPNFGGESGRT
jgi:light-regulated signal transduction histidine kinase (bacteriophytochrome)